MIDIYEWSNLIVFYMLTNWITLGGSRYEGTAEAKFDDESFDVTVKLQKPFEFIPFGLEEFTLRSSFAEDNLHFVSKVNEQLLTNLTISTALSNSTTDSVVINFQVPILIREEFEAHYTSMNEELSVELKTKLGSSEIELKVWSNDEQSTVGASLSTSFEALSNMSFIHLYKNLIDEDSLRTVIFNFNHFDQVFESTMDIRTISAGESNVTFTLVAPLFDWVRPHHLNKYFLSFNLKP